MRSQKAKHFIMKCGALYKKQPENKGIINAKDWINGSRAKIGDKFE